MAAISAALDEEGAEVNAEPDWPEQDLADSNGDGMQIQTISPSAPKSLSPEK